MKMNGMTSETTQSAILDDKMCELMLGLLDSDYPVKKIKENKRFKRGVMVENKKCYLPKDNIILFSELYNVLKLFYNASNDEIKYVIEKYYNLTL